MRVALVLALQILAVPAFGLEAHLVKDINPVPKPADSSPDYFAKAGAVAVFGADDGLSGRELWASDGTPGSGRDLRAFCSISRGLRVKYDYYY